jgi:hypothetical protein
VAPRLTDIQIVLPRRTRQMSHFSQRGLCQDKSEGEWGIVGKPCDMKKTRPEALLPPSDASGRLLGDAS